MLKISLIEASFCLPESTTKTANQSVQLCLHSSRQSVVWHVGATWQIRLNSCFLRPTQVHDTNGRSICSDVSAELTAESRCTSHGATLSPKLPLPMGDLWTPYVTNYSLGPSKPTIQTVYQPFLANVNSRSRSLYAIARPSVVCLSVVCL